MLLATHAVVELGAADGFVYTASAVEYLVYVVSSDVLSKKVRLVNCCSL